MTPEERKHREGQGIGGRSPQSSALTPETSTRARREPGSVPQSNLVEPSAPSRSSGAEPPRISPFGQGVLCDSDPGAHAPFLRPDMAYSVTGLDCYGDPLPKEREGRRAPAGECPENKHSHPPYLRSDIAWSVTGSDCEGR
jgi:hypothetical protein